MKMKNEKQKMKTKNEKQKTKIRELKTANCMVIQGCSYQGEYLTKEDDLI